jgi:hypothetical protein
MSNPEMVAKSGRMGRRTGADTAFRLWYGARRRTCKRADGCFRRSTRSTPNH